MPALRSLCLAFALAMLGAAVGAGAEPAGSGTADGLVLVGSDTMRPLVEAWAGAFRARHPGTSVEIVSRGSATAPKALASGRSQLAPMSREMTTEEVEAFESAHGYPPTGIVVAFDAIAIYVHEDNPIRGLTLDQLADVFSAERAAGGEGIERWGDLVYGALAPRSITLVGRNEESGTTSLFRDRVLAGSELRSGLKRYPSSAEVVRAVARDVTAIGYSSLGHRTEKAQPIALAANEDDPYVNYFVPNPADDPDPAAMFTDILSGRYPLARPLYLYVDKPPGQALAPRVAEFLHEALSAQGQQSAAGSGYVPLPASEREEELRKLQPDYEPGWWDRLRGWVR